MPIKPKRYAHYVRDASGQAVAVFVCIAVGLVMALGVYMFTPLAGVGDVMNAHVMILAVGLAALWCAVGWFLGGLWRR